MTKTALKKVLKQVLVETLRENPGVLRNAIAEAIEDLAISAAICEGATTKPVSRRRVMRALDNRSRR